MKNTINEKELERAKENFKRRLGDLVKTPQTKRNIMKIFLEEVNNIVEQVEVDRPSFVKRLIWFIKRK